MPRVTVDPERCENKKDCVRVCPEVVFAIRKPTYPLSLIAKIKVFAHGGKQAVVVNEAACTGCMLCVDACPERAIEVVTSV
jgi:NAD-dependent dihydropyrimidine dehydrogenase PreA subunit